MVKITWYGGKLFVPAEAWDCIWLVSEEGVFFACRKMRCLRCNACLIPSLLVSSTHYCLPSRFFPNALLFPRTSVPPSEINPKLWSDDHVEWKLNVGNWEVHWIPPQNQVFQLLWKGAFLEDILILHPVISFWSWNAIEIVLPWPYAGETSICWWPGTSAQCVCSRSPQILPNQEGLGQICRELHWCTTGFLQKPTSGELFTEIAGGSPSLISKHCIRHHPPSRISAGPSVSWCSVLCFKCYGIYNVPAERDLAKTQLIPFLSRCVCSLFWQFPQHGHLMILPRNLYQLYKP